MSKLYVFIFLLFFQYNFAQKLTIIGKVADATSNPIELGNVIALSVKDSSIIKGELFMDGNFKIINIEENDFLLKITAIGFSDNFQTIHRLFSDTLIDIGTIQLKQNATLKEVEVVSKTPLFERDGEKVKVNVENSALSSIGTVLDVLKKSPTVQVNSNDAVSVFGKGNAIIYLDGQQIASSDILKTISSTEIKEIEIIANPSAKYDATGQAVINIITKKNNLEGYNGNLIYNTLYGKYLFTYSGLRFNYKRKKWSTFVSYGFPHGKIWNSDEYYRNIKTNDSTTTELKNKLFTVNNQTNSNNYRAGLNYAIDTSSYVGFQYNGYYAQNRNITDNRNDIYKNTIPEYSLKTYTVAKPLTINNTANINYSKKLDTLKSEFTAAIQYGNFISKNLEEIKQEIITVGSTDTQIKRNRGLNNIQIFTAQADLTKAFNKKWKLESGVKESYVVNQSEINFENYSSTEEWISDPAYFNGYKYNENIAAGYSQLRYSKNKINARVGARAEYTKSDGFSRITGLKVIDREYVNIFPKCIFWL